VICNGYAAAIFGSASAVAFRTASVQTGLIHLAVELAMHTDDTIRLLPAR
jgi:hypothetical protein